ncbi:RICIN domain-containing protein, partial [Laspinema sp. D1]|nr:RICIN domain-containing protein [Laspinema sp. D2a]
MLKHFFYIHWAGKFVSLSSIFFALGTVSYFNIASADVGGSPYKQTLYKQGFPSNRTSPNSNGKFIVNTLSGKCIDVAGAPGTANGSQLLLWDCETSGRNRDNDSQTDQRWSLTRDGFIRNTLSGKCIDVAGAPGIANGSQLLLWDCETSGRNRDNDSQTD